VHQSKGTRQNIGNTNSFILANAFDWQGIDIKQNGMCRAIARVHGGATTTTSACLDNALPSSSRLNFEMREIVTFKQDCGKLYRSQVLGGYLRRTCIDPTVSYTEIPTSSSSASTSTSMRLLVADTCHELSHVFGASHDGICPCRTIRTALPTSHPRIQLDRCV
jgi:hypothetical protein